MQGPRHLPTYIEAVNQERDLVKHYRKLEEIQHTRKKDQLDADFATRSKIHELREKTMKFNTSEKALNIEKENELLLGKLVEISRKKSNIFGLKNEDKAYGTLNAPARRREKDRIAQENEAFARRLLSQQPSFNRKKLEGDYVRHNERVKSMQKLMFSPKRFKLPPLKKEDFDTRVTKSGAPKDKDELNKKKKKNNGSHTDSRNNAQTEQENREVENPAEEGEAHNQESEAGQRKEAEEKFEREEAERAEREKAREQAEQERALKEQADKEKAEKEAAEKEAEKERLEQERIEKEKEQEKKAEDENAVEEEIPEDKTA